MPLLNALTLAIPQRRGGDLKRGASAPVKRPDIGYSSKERGTKGVRVIININIQSIISNSLTYYLTLDRKSCLKPVIM